MAYEKEYFGGDVTLAAKAMESAGRALGRAVWQESGKRLLLNPKALLILGKGHNAGDALIACDELLKLHPALEVDLLPVFGAEAMAPAVWPWYERVRGNPAVRVLATGDLRNDVGAGYGLSIDGVFGMQFRPPLKGELIELFELINRSAIDVRVAVDLPSGVSDDNSETVLKADYTYATGILKSPLCKPENRKSCGRVRYLDLGFFEEKPELEVKVRVLAPQLLKRAEALRPVCSDKRSYGHLLVVAGSRSMPGALLMTVQSALRSGVGLVTVVAPESISTTCCAQAPEAMWLPWAETPRGGLALDGLLDLQAYGNKISAVLMGPGVSTEPESQALLDGICELFDGPFILDADALQEVRVALLKRMGKSMILTPHEGEFRRIAGLQGSDTITDAIIEGFCRNSGAIVVLKGPLSSIASGQERYFSPYGGPALARGGSGDLLSGLVAGKVANPGIPDLLESVAMGVVVHGKAADHLASLKGETHIHTTQILDHLNPF